MLGWALPGMPIPLSDVQLAENEEIADGFEALLDGVPVLVTAVLERTCVYVGKDGDHRLARKEELMVEPDQLPIRRHG